MSQAGVPGGGAPGGGHSLNRGQAVRKCVWGGGRMADHSVSRVVKCRVGVEVQFVEALTGRLRGWISPAASGVRQGFELSKRPELG